MLSPDREWFKCAGASPESIEALRSSAGVELPKEYFDLLKFSNGGEGPLSASPFTLCLESAESAAANKNGGTYTEFFQNFFVFGSNGGGDLLAFDLRGTRPWPIVAIDATNIDLDESVDLVAEEFQSFVGFIGRQHNA